MAIFASANKKVTFSGNTTSDWIPLSPGLNRILVKSTSWSGSSLALRYNDADTTNDFALKDGAGSAITATANAYHDVFGPGYVRGIMSSHGGTAVTLEVIDEETPMAGRT